MRFIPFVRNILAGSPREEVERYERSRPVERRQRAIDEGFLLPRS